MSFISIISNPIHSSSFGMEMMRIFKLGPIALVMDMEMHLATWCLGKIRSKMVLTRFI